MINELDLFSLNKELKSSDIAKRFEYLIFVFDDVKLPKKLHKIILDSNVCFYVIKNASEEITISEPHHILERLLDNSGRNGVFIVKGEKTLFVDVEDPRQINKILGMLKKKPLFLIKEKFKKFKKDNISLVHLSDLHIGGKGVEDNMPLLKGSLSERLEGLNCNIVISGDICDSPNPQNIEKYEVFRDFLEKISHHEVITVPGNHDVDFSGVAITRIARTLFSAFKKYPDITVIEEAKLVLLLFNSNEPDTGLDLAKGRIGENQMLKMDKEILLLSSRLPLDEYRKVAVLHHHVTSIQTPKEYKGGIIRKILYNEKTQILVDRDRFLEWLKDNDVHLVIHGHRHVPYLSTLENIDIVSCGSSTGKIELRKGVEMFVTYNIINPSASLCLQYFVTDTKKDLIIRPLEQFKKQA